MRYMSKLRALDFYSAYFMVLTLVTSYYPWFDATPASWMLIIILFALPYLFVRFFFQDKKIKRKMRKEKITGRYTGVIGCLLAIPGVILHPEDEVMPSVILCMVLFLITISLCLYAFAYDGKRKVLYQNPCVSQSTIEREEKVSFRNFRRIILIAVAMAFFGVSLIWVLPEGKAPVSMEHQKEQEKLVEKQQKLDNEQMQFEKIKEQNEEAKENLFFRILRYALLITLIILTVWLIAYVIFRFILYVIRGRGKGEVEYIEEKIEDNGMEEYTRLVPVIRRSAVFSNDNNGIVRKVFYKEVRKGARPFSVTRTLTPLEMSQRYLNMENISEDCIRIYEKARYSNQMVTEKEVALFTQIQHK